jgi:uncharacterized protein YdaU (DUF1376 family)
VIAMTADRLPWFKFFPMDWVSSETMERFTVEQEGAYMRLLCRQWMAKDGYLTNDEEILQGWSGLNGRWRKVGRPIIQKCFVRRANHRLENTKLRELWEDARVKHEKARKSAEQRWKKYKKGHRRRRR